MSAAACWASVQCRGAGSLPPWPGPSTVITTRLAGCSARTSSQTVLSRKMPCPSTRGTLRGSPDRMRTLRRPIDVLIFWVISLLLALVGGWLRGR
jgi:hypothetical protein